MSVSVIEEEGRVLLRMMDRLYTIQCHDEKFNDLTQSAHYLDCKMHEIASSKTMPMDRIVVIAALNAVYELLTQVKQKEACIHHMRQRLSHLYSKLTHALGE